MTGEATAALEREVRIEAPPEVVYEFFTDREKLLRWQGTEAELDPRPGGVFRVNVDGGHVARGEYVELVPAERVVFTWGWEGGDAVPPGASTVEVTFRRDGDATVVRLRHALPPGSVDDHAEGWRHYLSRLAVAAGGGDPGPDPWAADRGAESAD